MKSLLVLVALSLFVASCSHQSTVSNKIVADAVPMAPPKYVIVGIVHGDGSYRVHDESGGKFDADEVVVSKMHEIAASNLDAEVFVFHQKRRKHFLLVFPRRDGEMYYFRNGQLLAQESYWRDHGNSRFDPEIELFQRYVADFGEPQTKVFLYFGHEIPEVGGRRYDASHRDRSFTVDDLADGLDQFSDDSSRFDLAMLSTCYNGTPYTIARLSPYARYIIASPGNLHLSYFDLAPLANLDQRLAHRPMSDFALEWAQQSFDRLQRDIQTEITVSVYDVDRVGSYVNVVDNLYGDRLEESVAVKESLVDHCDCADDSAYVTPSMSDGVTILYRPAKFGRSKNKTTHSGWGCLKLPD